MKPTLLTQPPGVASQRPLARALARAVSAALLLTLAIAPAWSDSDQGGGKIRRVLLISIDGMHSLDLANFITYLEYAALRELGGGDCWSELGSKPMLCLRYHLAKAIAIATPREADVPKVYLRFAELLRPRVNAILR